MRNLHSRLSESILPSRPNQFRLTSCFSQSTTITRDALWAVRKGRTINSHIQDTKLESDGKYRYLSLSLCVYMYFLFFFSFGNNSIKVTKSIFYLTHTRQSEPKYWTTLRQADGPDVVFGSQTMMMSGRATETVGSLLNVIKMITEWAFFMAHLYNGQNSSTHTPSPRQEKC